MEKPNLNRMWETFIKIGLPQQVSHKMLFDTIRFRINQLITDLRDKGMINWYHFLIHNRESGVPTTPDDDNMYFHIRVSLADKVKYGDFRKSLPEYCVLTQPCDQKSIAQISIAKGIGFDTSKLESEGIEEVWRIIGEQSEWFLNLLCAHKRDVDIPLLHIHPFLHYYCNMTQLRVRCPYCKNVLNCANLMMVR